MDDGVIAGKHDEVLKAFRIIQRLGPPLGMDLNIKKNELVKFSSRRDSFPDECERFYNNFELLGAPIGDEDYCTEYITSFVKRELLTR